MRLVLSIVLLVLFSIAVSGRMSEEDIECYFSVAKGCDHLISREMQGNPNAEELDEICDPLRKVTQCFRDLSRKNCSEKLADAIHEFVSIFDEMCDAESEYGRVYRESIDCINDQRNELNDCIHRKWQEDALSEIRVKSDDYEDDRLYFCVGGQIAKQCREHHIGSACGEVAAGIEPKLRRFFNTLLGPEPCTDDELKHVEELLS